MQKISTIGVKNNIFAVDTERIIKLTIFERVHEKRVLIEKANSEGFAQSSQAFVVDTEPHSPTLLSGCACVFESLQYARV